MISEIFKIFGWFLKKIEEIFIFVFKKFEFIYVMVQDEKKSQRKIAKWKEKKQREQKLRDEIG